MRNGLIGGIVLAVLLIVGIVCGAVCLEKVPAGYAAVVYNMNGGIEEKVLTQGWHILAPTKKATNYTIGIEQSYLTAKKEGDSPEDDSFEVPTSDGKGLKVDLTFTYHYDIERLPQTFTRFKGQSGKEVLKSFIKPNIIAWTKEVTALYPVTEILGDKRQLINSKVAEYLAEKFDVYGIIIENATLIDISPDEETRSAIQQKVNAQQRLELANIEAQTARVQAEKDKQVAQIDAEKAVIEAEAKAKAVKIAAEAEADANREIAQSITQGLIDYTYAQAWDGMLPRITSGGATIVNAADYLARAADEPAA